MTIGGVLQFCLAACIPMGCLAPLLVLRVGRKRAGWGFGLLQRKELDRYAKLMVAVCGVLFGALCLSFVPLVFELLLFIAGALLLVGAAWGWLLALRLVASIKTAQREWLGQCTRCGYSLRGNTTGVCPECGAAVSEPIRTG